MRKKDKKENKIKTVKKSFQLFLVSTILL